MVKNGKSVSILNRNGAAIVATPIMVKKDMFTSFHFLQFWLVFTHLLLANALAHLMLIGSTLFSKKGNITKHFWVWKVSGYY